MKFLKPTMAALVIATLFVACKKDNDSKPPFKMEGVWEGKIGQNSSIPTGQYKLNIKAGGIVERVSSNGSVSATGTWELKGNNFSATYNYTNGTIVVVDGTVDKNINKVTAEWSNNGGEEGTLYINKL